jgi:lysophospholipase L1-like esterase
VTAGSLVALGDSITNAQDSWADRLGAWLGLAVTKLAGDGAEAPHLRAALPRIGGPHVVAAVWIGVNDARSVRWDAEAYARDLDAIAAAAGSAAERLLLVTLPADLGRPPAAPKPVQANGLIRAIAAERGAVVADLEDLAGARWFAPDAVHLTPAGQAEVARRAAAALAPTP